MIEIIREPNGPVTIRISEESIEDVKEILSSLFRESSFTQTRLQALSARFEGLEASIGELVGINKELAQALMQRGEEKRARLPARGTKYYNRLWTLCATHLDGTFTSDDVPSKEKHILSILKNEYEVLEVAQRKGRRNYYRVKAEIARGLLKDQGHWFSVNVEPSKRVDADLMVAEEKESNDFLVDVREGEGGPVYEFFFPDPKKGRAFEEKLLAMPTS